MKNLITVLMLLGSVNSYATGGTTCDVDNEEIELNVNLTNGRVFGNPLVEPSSVKVKIKKNMLAVGLTEYTFKTEEIPYWFNLYGELKLGSYAEPTHTPGGDPIDAFVTLAVVLDTKFVDVEDEPGYYVGSYRIIQTSYYQGEDREKIFEGSIRCDIH